MPFAPLEGVRRGCRAVVSSVRGGGAAVAGLARPGGQRHGRADRRQGPAAGGAVALSVPGVAAAGACPPARRRAARSRGARAQHLHHLLPRPAHGHLLGLRRRQVGAAVDAGAQRRRRRLGDRADRRARPRGAGVPPGRPRRGGPRPLGRGGRDLRRAGADAPPGRLSDAGHRRILPRPGQARAGADGLRSPASPWRSARSGLPPASRRPPRAIRRPCLPSCRGCWSAPAPGPARAPSPASSPCWSRATTTTSRSPTRCAPSSTATS